MKNNILYNIVVLYGLMLYLINIISIVSLAKSWLEITIGGLIAIIIPPCALFLPFTVWVITQTFPLSLFIFWVIGVILVLSHAHINYNWLKK